MGTKEPWSSWVTVQHATARAPGQIFITVSLHRGSGLPTRLRTKWSSAADMASTMRRHFSTAGGLAGSTALTDPILSPRNAGGQAVETILGITGIIRTRSILRPYRITIRPN